VKELELPLPEVFEIGRPGMGGCAFATHSMSYMVRNVVRPSPPWQWKCAQVVQYGGLRWGAVLRSLRRVAGAVRQVGAEPTMFESILSDVRSEIEQGVAFALAAPFPKPKQVTEHVYA
jgi:hypothetical protein